MGAQKNHLNEMVLLSTHNICFGREMKKKELWPLHTSLPPMLIYLHVKLRVSSCNTFEKHAEQASNGDKSFSKKGE